jgi:hypothetical protein
VGRCIAHQVIAQAAEPAWWTQQKSNCGLPSGTAYNTWVSQGSPCKSATSLPAIGGLNARQQMMMNATGTVLQMMINEAEEAEARERARQAAEAAAKAARDADTKIQQDARLEEASRRLQGATGAQKSLGFKGVDASAGLALKPLDAEERASLRDAVRDPHPEIDAYLKGSSDAGNCKPQNSGSVCASASRENHALCVRNYASGYQVGEGVKKSILEGAYLKGKQDKENSASKLAKAPQRIPDKCGVKWITAYLDGFNGMPFTLAGR